MFFGYQAVFAPYDLGFGLDPLPNLFSGRMIFRVFPTAFGFLR